MLLPTVHWRPDFVAAVGQELGFRFTRLLRGIFGSSQRGFSLLPSSQIMPDGHQNLQGGEKLYK